VQYLERSASEQVDNLYEYVGEKKAVGKGRGLSPIEHVIGCFDLAMSFIHDAKPHIIIQSKMTL